MLLMDSFALFMMGLLGAGHCLGMCGGIASALALQGSASSLEMKKQQLINLVFYNIGRLSSYVLISLLIASVIFGLGSLVDFKDYLIYLRIFSVVMLFLVAFYISQLWNGLVVFEKLGQYIWRYLSPISSKILPIRSPRSAFLLGVVWGWLPCGMVYSALSLSVTTGRVAESGFLMLAFGLGTLPAMLIIGSTAEFTKFLLQNPWFRRFAALLLFGYSTFSAYLILHPHL